MHTDKAIAEFEAWWDRQPFREQFEDVKDQMRNVWLASRREDKDMHEAKRSDQFVEIIESQVGQWVKFEDFDKAESDKKELEAQVLSLRANCSHLAKTLSQACENLKKARKERDRNHAKRCALRDEIGPIKQQHAQLLEALECAISQVPELASVPGIAAAIEAVGVTVRG